MPSAPSSAMKNMDKRAKAAWKENFQNFEGFDWGGNIPEGEYLIQVSGASLTETRDGDPVVMFNYVVAEGDHEGQPVRDRHTINEQGKRTIQMALNMLAGVIQRLGYPTEGCTNSQGLVKLLDQITKDKKRYNITFTPNDYGGNIRILGLADGEEAPVASDEEESGEEEFFEEGDEGDSSEWAVGDWCTVNDPQDPDCPWTGEISEIVNDQEVNVKSDEDGEEWTVRMEFVEPYEDGEEEDE